jgi:hemerythrin-like domain-containing protein
MKTSTENLENDHVYILRLTEIMKKMTESDSADPSHIEIVIDTIRNFADGLHHAKEEELLFPAMETKGFSKSQGPVAVMLHEHVEGRNYVRAITDNLPLYKSGNKDALTIIYDSMNGYAELLQNHIAKENNILFRMADKVFSETEQKELLRKFEKIEDEREDGRRPSDYIAVIQKLSELYNID